MVVLIRWCGSANPQ